MNDWLFNDSFNLFNSLFDNDLLNDSFNNLRNFNDFFNDSGYDHDFFDDSLNFNNFRYFDHFFNDLLDWNFNLSYPVNVSDNFYDFLFDILYGFRHLDVVVDDFFDLDDLWLSDYLRISKIDFFDDCLFGSLDNGLLHNLNHFHNFLLENRYLNDAFNFFDYLSILDNDSVSDNFNLFDSILNNNFFSNHWHFIRLFYDGVRLNNSLNDLRNLDNFLYSLDDRNGLLNDSVNNLVSDLDVIFDLFGVSVLNYLDYLFDDFLDFDNLRDLHNFLDYLFDDDWHFDDLLNYPL